MSFTHLFSPGKIGNMTLRNRAIMPAMATRMAESDYTVGKRLIAYHALRAKNGCALNITEFTAVDETTHFQCTPALYDDKFVEGFSALASALHAEGGKLCVQLWHAGRQTNREQNGGFELLAPSAIALAPGWETPRALTIPEIERLIEAFGDAAIRAKKAGADAVEVHGAHGYLIGQFSSAWSNQRTDEYGGSIENRARFATSIIKNVRKKVGPDFPIIFRLTAEERIPASTAMNTQEAIQLARLAEQAGADAIHVSIGGYCALWDMIPPIEIEPGFNVHNAVAVKKAVNIPVITVGRINEPRLADDILKQGAADFVAIGRAQLADAAFLKKAAEGRADEIQKCIACNQGCIGRYGNSPNGAHLTCLRNPLCGHEFLYETQRTKQPKKVLIAGGGVAGLEAGRMLCEAGHQVSLCEKSEVCGGQFMLAGIPPHKAEISAAVSRMVTGAKRAGVLIHVSTPLTEELIAAQAPDYIVIATGATPLVPPIDGIAQAVLAQDVLSGLASVGKSVAILGGGLVGIETAEYLTQQGKDVRIIEMLDILCPKADAYKRHFIDEYLKAENIPVHLKAKCTSINQDSVTVQTETETLSFAADSVVVAAGYRADPAMEALVRSLNIPYQVIGDAKSPRLAIDAIKEAFDLTLSLA